MSTPPRTPEYRQDMRSFPKWVQALDKAPRHLAIVGSIVVTFSLAACCSLAMMSGGEKVETLNSDWKSANKEYMKFQNMNPIFGVSKDKEK
mmetsp:Transcript_12590/g.12223  ORF Transcript_12590/g.12223 Transcript_12590/m.12223 type:complete len:91 (-) Transcript_12590:263-535(-)